MSSLRQRFSPVTAVFLIVLVDVLGFTIILPLLPFYAEKFGASPLVIGSLLAAFAACQLVSGPFFGRLSDSVGRKPLLLVSQVGSCLSFVLLAFAPSMSWVFIARILDGATAGNISLAQAAISDVTAPHERGKAFSKVGIAFGIGFLIGPALSGFLARYGYEVPILTGAALSALSIIATAVLLPGGKGPAAGGRTAEAEAEAAAATRAGAMAAGAMAAGATAATTTAGTTTGPAAAIKTGRAKVFDWAQFVGFFRVPALRLRLLQFLTFIMAFAMYTSCIALFAARRLEINGKMFGASEVAYILAYGGLLGIFMQGFLMGRLIKRYGEAALVNYGFVAMAVGMGVLATAHGLAIALVAATFTALGHGILRPVLTSLVSQSAGPKEQGAVLGVSQSLQSVAQILAPLLGGWLIEQQAESLWAVAAALFAGFGLMGQVRRKDPI